ncbi:hypothetical protein GSI_04525 [Ganoderma sinense ZZ0214-1]|uniref:Uncharacterized protein n=1 Tax=Ganoderma sinense ZZ0214-1 TaxID=1077348 RepID=A0A2G8SH37_9APHY|nr:hypothetical protein GSI_04525 [Ganoderma sinense ZZ0214-1]
MPCGLPFANVLSTALSLVPPTDQTGVGELSISDMRAWSEAKSDEYHRYSLAFNAIRNVLAPVHRLPPDILSRIFVEAWQDRKSLRLTHVCRLWRTLLLDTSEFWAVAISGDQFRLPTTDDSEESSDEDYLGSACLHSSARNISLRLSSISPRIHYQLTQNAYRITSMHIYTYTRDQLDLLWKLLYAGMPRLESLVVQVSNSVAAWTGPRPLSTEELPLLTRLTLPARLFMISHSWPNRLQALALRSFYGNAELDSPFMVPLDMVLRSLEDYPSLKVLDIRDNALSYSPNSQPPSRAFPALELLRIRLQHHTISALLSFLTIPSSARLDISIVFPSWPAYGDLFVAGGAQDAVVALVDYVTIFSGPMSTVRGFTVRGSECLRVTASLDDTRRTVHLFKRTDAPVSRLLLAQHTAQRKPLPFGGRFVFAAFPHVTHLTIHGRKGVCAGFLRALYPPPPPSGDPPPLPLLTDLTVGVATKRRSAISESLRRGDVTHKRDGGAFVPVHFRECCRLFPKVSVPNVRSERGYRLSRFELFSYEEGCMGKPDSVVSHVDLAALMPELVERGIKPLRGLVDGSVVFSGYRFFMDA